MPYHVLEPGDEEFLEKCPVCDEGYMVPTYGKWYQCSECGVDAKKDEYGILWFDKEVFGDEDSDDFL